MIFFGFIVKRNCIYTRKYMYVNMWGNTIKDFKVLCYICIYLPFVIRLLPIPLGIDFHAQ